MRSAIVEARRAGAASNSLRTTSVQLLSLRRLVSFFSAIPGRVRSRFGPYAQCGQFVSRGASSNRDPDIQIRKREAIRKIGLGAWACNSGGKSAQTVPLSSDSKVVWGYEASVEENVSRAQDSRQVLVRSWPVS